MRGTPQAVNAPETTGRFEWASTRYRRQASAMSCGTSLRDEGGRQVVDVLAGRPRASRTRRSRAWPASRAGCVRRSSTRSAEEAGTKWTRSPSSVACGAPSRSWSTMAEGAVRSACSTTARGKSTRLVAVSTAIPTVASRARACRPRSARRCARAPSASSTIRPGSAGSSSVRTGRMAGFPATGSPRCPSAAAPCVRQAVALSRPGWPGPLAA